MKPAILLALSVLLSVPVSAIDNHPVRGDRIGILVPEGSSRSSPASLISRNLVDDLQRAGFAARVIRSAAPDLPPGTRTEDYYLEVGLEDSGGGMVAGIGGAASGHVGADVSIMSANLRAAIRLYDGPTMNLLDSFSVQGGGLSPVLSGVGIGGRNGYLWLMIPFLSDQPYRTAAREIARETVGHITRRASNER